MKKFLITISVFLALAISACKQEDLITYQGKPDIYFDEAARLPRFQGEVLTDSTIIAFAYSKANDTTLKIIVGVAGLPSAEDRPYKLVASAASTAVAGQHYDPLPATLTVKGNKLFDTVMVKLHRRPDMETAEKVLILDLQPNEQFVTNMSDRVINTTTGKKLSFISYKIHVSDIVTRPSRWFDGYLGTFSRKKFFLMVEVLNIEPAFFAGSPSLAVLGAYGRFMQRYLNEMKAAGKTVLEEDGTEMIMGPSSQ